MGFLIDFLSHAAIVGFMGGAAITIALQQLKGFLGIKNFTKKTDIISVMHSVFGAAHNGVSYIYLCNSFVHVFSHYLCLFLLYSIWNLQHLITDSCVTKFWQWNWQTIVIGASFLTFLIVAKYIVRSPNTLPLLT